MGHGKGVGGSSFFWFSLAAWRAFKLATSRSTSFLACKQVLVPGNAGSPASSQAREAGMALSSVQWVSCSTVTVHVDACLSKKKNSLVCAHTLWAPLPGSLCPSQLVAASSEGFTSDLCAPHRSFVSSKVCLHIPDEGKREKKEKKREGKEQGGKKREKREKKREPQKP